MKYLQDALKRLETDASRRKERLQENAALLQFIWKADVVESWIGKLEPRKTLGKFHALVGE
jgi:spectrin alpha